MNNKNLSKSSKNAIEKSKKKDNKLSIQDKKNAFNTVKGQNYTSYYDDQNKNSDIAYNITKYRYGNSDITRRH